jgi:hypothetical protein
MSDSVTICSRREVLTGLAAVAGGASGCSSFSPGYGASTTPPAVETPPPEGCEPIRVPYPSSVEEFSPREYPGYPERLESAEAEDYATLFELALQYNRVLARAGSAYESLNIRGAVPEAGIERTENGYIVGVTTTLRLADPETETASATAAPSGEIRSGGWYYLTDGFGVRSSVPYGTVEDGRASDAVFERPEVIVCDGTIRTTRG